MTWTAADLPGGLSLDPSSGIIRGIAPPEGTYRVEVSAENKLGRTSDTITIVSGIKLALTPPMGWNSWNTFSTEVSDSLIRQIADSMVSSGLRDLGYHYINIDDFWQLAGRDAEGNIRVNPEKFPEGIKAVADYVHERGMKLGIYSDAADLTCGGVAGSYGYEERDARAFAEWGVDLLKYDYCHAPPAKDTAIIRYTRMQQALLGTGRSIVYSVCEWGQREPWTWAAGVGGNYWRTTWDIRNSWMREEYSSRINSIMQIVDINSQLADYAGPGHWNDPDMLLVGIHDNPAAWVVNKDGATGCNDLEYRSHMSLWCLMASPIILGNDIRTMNPYTRETLMNPEIIAINQDPLGMQARKIRDEGDHEVFSKPMSDGSVAVGLLNRHDAETARMQVSWEELGIKGDQKVRDIWEHKDLGRFSGSFETSVSPHQCVVIKISK